MNLAYCCSNVYSVLRRDTDGISLRAAAPVCEDIAQVTKATSINVQMSLCCALMHQPCTKQWLLPLLT